MLKVKSKIVYRIGVQLVVNNKIIDDNAFKNIDFVDLYECVYIAKVNKLVYSSTKKIHKTCSHHVHLC
jgi:hypothetical protein